MDTWPIGTRDTTEFPKISPVKVQYRDHLEKILKLHGKDWNDIGEFGTPSRFRSYRKMYERLGIICKNGDKLASTWLGEKIAKLEQGLSGAQQVYLDQMRSEIIAILSRYQFKNPSDRDSVSFPDDFDIQPCVCIWKIMLALDNKINYQEVNRVVLRIMHMADIDAAIEKINSARTELITNPNASLDDILGLPVVTDQPSARIAGLFSQIGWGDLLITGVQEDGFRYLISDAIPLIKKIIENPPSFYKARSEKDWVDYFIGKPLGRLGLVGNVDAPITPKLSLSELGQLLAEDYQRASYVNAVWYCFVFKYADSLFDELGNPIYKPQALVKATNGVVKKSFWAEINKAYKVLERLKTEPQEYDYLRRILGGANSPAPLRTIADRLSTALKLFAAKRKDAGVDGWFKDGYVTNGQMRKYFSALTEPQILAFTDSQFEDFFLGEVDPATGKHKKENYRMWAGSISTGWDSIKPDNPAELQAANQFIASVQKDSSIAAQFCKKGFAHPKGFGPSVVSELLMKFHPDSCFKHGRITNEILSWLGLIDFPHKSDFSDAEYKQACGAAAKILAKMTAMKIPRQINADGTDDTSPPDYLTVNEFIWFVKDKLQDIKNEVATMQQKTVTQNRTEGNNDWEKLPNDNPDSLMYRLAASLLTRPFAILAGASGTGKSRMVKKLACMTCYDDDLKPSGEKALGNYQMVQVKPSWHDSSELLGYRSMLNPDPNVVDYKTTDFVRFVLKAHAYPHTPFFVCLDEMNLAPVEQYFAEFLSACESVEKKTDAAGDFYVTSPLVPQTEYNDNIENIGLEYPLPQEVKDRLNKFGLFIPRNLFIVGTVNMDDTTCQFSRKVLDRAMTIEMNEVKFDTLKVPEELVVDGQNGLLMKKEQIEAFINRKDFDKCTLDSEFLALLEGIQGIVKPTPFAVGYRFALETSMYREALKVINPEKMKADKKDAQNNVVTNQQTGEPEKVDVSLLYALDHMILTKILPRITGNKSDRKELTDALKKYFVEKLVGHALSATALESMLERADHNGGYLSFWP